MRKVLSAAFLVAAVLASSATSAFAAEEKVDIKDVDLSDWPKVAISVAVPEGTGEGVSVTENGVAVEADIATFQETGERVEVVLVIDTSGSMQGQPMTAAIAAAKQFIQNLPDNIEVGVVTFSDDPTVAQRITADHDAAFSAVSSLVARGETALYDGVRSAAGLFSSGAQRNIILLSDGGDTASSSTLRAAAKGAADMEAAIFAVGLKSGEFDADALRTLARETEGGYAPAASADLTKIYEDFATQLSSQFVVTYKSATEGGSELSLVVNSEALSDSALVRAPEIAAPVVPKPLPPVEQKDPLLEGAAGLAAVLVLTFAAAFALFWMVTGRRARKARDRKLAEAMEADPQIRHEGRTDQGLATWLPDPLVDVAERVAGKSDFAKNLDSQLERGGVKLKSGEFLAMSLLTAAVGALLGALVLPKLIFIVAFAGLGFFAPRAWLALTVHRRLNKMHGQIADILMIIASSLRAGHSFMQALDAVGKEIPEPGCSEFSRLVAEIRLGRPVDEAMNDLADRIASEDFRWAVLAVNIQRDVGGNLAEVLDTVAETIRERDNVRRQVKVLSAEGKMSIYILAGLPIGLAAYMAIVNPDYLGLLWTTRIGLVMLSVASSLMVLGILWMRKVVKIDV